MVGRVYVFVELLDDGRWCWAVGALRCRFGRTATIAIAGDGCSGILRFIGGRGGMLCVCNSDSGALSRGLSRADWLFGGVVCRRGCWPELKVIHASRVRNSKDGRWTIVGLGVLLNLSGVGLKMHSAC